jgi:hypothetical protein
MKSRITLLLVLLFTASVLPQGKFTGYIFGDYFYNASRDTAVSGIKNAANGGAKDLNGFNIRRAYLTYDNDINCCFTSRFRFEMTDKENLTDGKIGVFVKDAYIKWKGFVTGHDVTIGIQPTPAYEVSEKAWSYRPLEKTIMDLRGAVSSRDFGVSINGKLDEEGNYSYTVMYANGSSTGLEKNKYKRFYAQVHLKPFKNFQTTLYADLNGKANINDPNSATKPSATIGNNSTTYAAFAGYAVKEKYSFGVEGYLQTTQNGNKIGAKTPYEISILNTLGYSLFGTYNFTKELVAVARYDFFDPNTKDNALLKGDSRNYFIFGADCKLDKNFSLMPNILIETYESLPNGGQTFKSSITPRITFFYNFL